MGETSLNPPWTVEYAALAALAVVLAAGWLAWRSTRRCAPRLRAALTGLRVAGALCLAVVALNPGRWLGAPRTGRTGWALLLDRSGSMAVADVEGRPRWQAALRGAMSALADGRADTARVGTFSNAVEWRRADDLAGLAADGGDTDILGAVRDALSRYRTGGERLTGIVVLSDGRQLGPGAVAELGLECRAQEAPVYAVPLGGPVPASDLSVTPVRRQYVGFAGQRLRVAVAVGNEGLGLLRVPVQLRGGGGPALAERTVELPPGARVTVAFDLDPQPEGYHRFTATAPAIPGETNPLNNSAVIAAAVLKAKVRVLTVEGQPGWDSKFLIQLLRGQSALLEVTSVYRVAASRFFRVDTDAARVAESTTPIFPDTAEELAAYDVVILGKGADYFLTAERVALLRHFLREQGGCLVFARGRSSTQAFPALAALEPAEWGAPVGVPVRMAPTPEGERAGLFGDLLPAANDPVWSRLPPVESAAACTAVKAFGRVLMQGTPEGAAAKAPIPLVVAWRYGRGLVLGVNAEGLWRWDFFPLVGDAHAVYQELWPRLLHWAFTYAEFLPGQRYALRLSDNSVWPETPVTVHVTARQAAPGRLEPPRLRVAREDRPVEEQRTAPAGGSADRWSAVLALREPGLYRVDLALDGSEPAPPGALLHVRARPAEGDNRGADHDFLRQLAVESGGRLVAPEELPSLARQLAAEPPAESAGKNVWQPLWDRSWFLALSLSFFGVDWFIRRRRGLS